MVRGYLDFERLYRFVDDNPLVEFHPCDRTNDTHHIRQNPKVVAINSALEVDLSGPAFAPGELRTFVDGAVLVLISAQSGG